MLSTFLFQFTYYWEKRVTRIGTLSDLSMIYDILSRSGADVDLGRIGRDGRCDGFSGADMSALVREASMAALKDALKAQPAGRQGIQAWISF